MASGFHEDFERRSAATSSSDRAFGFVMAAVFFLIALAPVVRGGGPRWWAAVTGLGLLAVALLAAQWLAPLNRAWTWLGMQLHRVVSPVVLGLLFAGFIVIGRFAGRRSREALGLRFDRDRHSYWVHRNPPGTTPQTMRNQF